MAGSPAINDGHDALSIVLFKFGAKLTSTAERHRKKRNGW